MNKNVSRLGHSPVYDLFRLDGRIALVTGAAGYLGKSFTTALCEAGAHVILNGRTLQTLEKFADDLRAKQYTVSTAAFDITQEHLLKEHVQNIESEYGRLDILVNNAYAGQSGSIETATWQDFDQACRVCLTAAFGLIRITKPLLEKAAAQNRGGASVINIASMYAVVSPDPSIYGDSGANNPPYYGAAKAGLIQLTRYAACHLAPWNIRVNSISPGPFPVPNIIDKKPLFYQELCKKNPMKRIGYPDELKGALLFLASDASSYVTGINLPVDGGWTAW